MRIFIKIESPEIKGECKVFYFEDYIEAYSVRFGATRDAIAGAAKGAKASAASVTPVMITKAVDLSSVKLFERMMLGTAFGKVTINCCELSENPIDTTVTEDQYFTFYAITLTKAHIIQFNTSNSAADQVPVDDFSLDYEKIELYYATEDGKGKFTSKWDLKTNSNR